MRRQNITPNAIEARKTVLKTVFPHGGGPGTEWLIETPNLVDEKFLREFETLGQDLTTFPAKPDLDSIKDPVSATALTMGTLFSAFQGIKEKGKKEWTPVLVNCSGVRKVKTRFSADLQHNSVFVALVCIKGEFILRGPPQLTDPKALGTVPRVVSGGYAYLFRCPVETLIFVPDAPDSELVLFEFYSSDEIAKVFKPVPPASAPKLSHADKIARLRGLVKEHRQREAPLVGGPVFSSQVTAKQSYDFYCSPERRKEINVLVRKVKTEKYPAVHPLALAKACYWNLALLGTKPTEEDVALIAERLNSPLESVRLFGTVLPVYGDNADSLVGIFVQEWLGDDAVQTWMASRVTDDILDKVYSENSDYQLVIRPGSFSKDKRVRDRIALYFCLDMTQILVGSTILTEEKCTESKLKEWLEGLHFPRKTLSSCIDYFTERQLLLYSAFLVPSSDAMIDSSMDDLDKLVEVARPSSKPDELDDLTTPARKPKPENKMPARKKKQQQSTKTGSKRKIQTVEEEDEQEGSQLDDEEEEELNEDEEEEEEEEDDDEEEEEGEDETPKDLLVKKTKVEPVRFTIPDGKTFMELSNKDQAMWIRTEEAKASQLALINHVLAECVFPDPRAATNAVQVPGPKARGYVLAFNIPFTWMLPDTKRPRLPEEKKEGDELARSIYTAESLFVYDYSQKEWVHRKGEQKDDQLMMLRKSVPDGRVARASSIAIYQNKQGEMAMTYHVRVADKPDDENQSKWLNHELCNIYLLFYDVSDSATASKAKNFVDKLEKHCLWVKEI